MKVLLFCLFLIPILGFGQEYKKIINTNTGEKILIGITSKKVYQDKDFSEWFNNEYTNYKVDTDLLSHYKDKLEGKVIRIVLGTWCSDSRREVPRFIKILDFLDFPNGFKIHKRKIYKIPTCKPEMAKIWITPTSE